MVGQAPIIALLICMIFDEVSQAVPFLLTISAVWFGVNNAAREIVYELPIYKRERMFNQGIIPYLLSKITVLCSFATLQCILFTFMISVRFNSEDPSWKDPLSTFFWMLFISLISALMGLFLSAIMNTVEKVMTFVPIVLIPQIMLAGLIAKITNKLVEFLSYFTISRWGTEGFSIIQQKVRITIPSVAAPTNPGEMQVPGSPPTDMQNGSRSMVVNAVDNLKESFHTTMYQDWFGSYHSTLKLDVIMLSILGFVFFICIFIALRKKDPLKIR
jgi:ABC-type multidrug transport system permease subunit